MARYKWEYLGQGLYQFTEIGVRTFVFRRRNLRQLLEEFGKSSHWVGSLIREFNKAFPYETCRFKKEKVLESYSLGELVAYLRERGYAVYAPLPFRDEDIVGHLGKFGFKVSRPLADDFK